MNPEEINEELFDLLYTKSYSELSEDERKLLTGHMTAREYDDYRMIVSGFKTEDAKLHTFENDNLEKPNGGSKIIQLLNYRVPLYKVAAGFIILATAIFIFNLFSDPKISPKTLPDNQLVLANDEGKSIAEDNYPEQFMITF